MPTKPPRKTSCATPKPWDRTLWGIEFHGRGTEHPILIGTAWNPNLVYSHPNEPTRALLFTSRKSARAWCKSREAACKELGWRFVPVKVRETVVKVTEKAQA